jgi:hypothetical protein
MTTLTLLAKIYSSSQLKQIVSSLASPFEGLDVEIRTLGVTAEKWAQIALSGEDENIAVNYITKNIGTCPTNLESITKYATVKGYLVNPRESNENLLVDIGVFQPNTIYAAVPVSELQARLLDGKNVELKKIAELFGFCENLPISIRIVKVDQANGFIQGELSTAQLKKYEIWRESLLDRLIVIGASLQKIKKTVEYAELDRDVINVEALGVFEYALTCKLGTDAAGLISKIGRTLRNASFSVFSPKRIELWNSNKSNSK